MLLLPHSHCHQSKCRKVKCCELEAPASWLWVAAGAAATAAFIKRRPRHALLLALPHVRFFSYQHHDWRDHDLGDLVEADCVDLNAEVVEDDKARVRTCHGCCLLPRQLLHLPSQAAGHHTCCAPSRVCFSSDARVQTTALIASSLLPVRPISAARSTLTHALACAAALCCVATGKR